MLILSIHGLGGSALAIALRRHGLTRCQALATEAYAEMILIMSTVQQSYGGELRTMVDPTSVPSRPASLATMLESRFPSKESAAKRCSLRTAYTAYARSIPTFQRLPTTNLLPSISSASRSWFPAKHRPSFPIPPLQRETNQQLSAHHQSSVPTPWNTRSLGATRWGSRTIESRRLSRGRGADSATRVARGARRPQAPGRKSADVVMRAASRSVQAAQGRAAWVGGYWVLRRAVSDFIV